MSWDVALLRTINITWSNPVFDAIMPVISNLKMFIPLILLLVLWLVFRDGRRGRITVLALILVIAGTDQLSSSVLKPWAGRYRPCHPSAGIEGLRVPGHCSSRPTSMPSSHAANMAAVAMFFLLRYGWRAGIGVAIALVVGYSRVYLGVHYPTDVLVGWGVGALTGTAVGVPVNFWERRRFGTSPRPEGEPGKPPAPGPETIDDEGNPV